MIGEYKVIRASTSGRRPPPSTQVDPRGRIVVRTGSWEQCEDFLVRLKESRLDWFESRWAGHDMLVRIAPSNNLFIVYRIIPEEES